MSIPSLALCLAVIDKQYLNLGLLHKEMTASLNLKGRDVLLPISEIMNKMDVR